MRQMQVPNFATPVEGYKVYNRFRGVDYSADEAMIDDSRSPEAINLISDAGGSPEKRLGWRTLHRFDTGARVGGIFTFTHAGAMHLVVHCGAKLLRLVGEEAVELMDGLHEGRSRGFYFGGKLYILTGGDYLVYDGLLAKRVSEDAYIPLTSIARPPAGGGKSYERANLLTDWRKNNFVGDGTAKEFQTDAKAFEPGSTPRVWVGDEEKTAGFIADHEHGKIVFDAAPAASPNNAPNVIVQFQAKDTKNADKIRKCTCFATFGYGNENRVFLSGNADDDCMEWYSGLGDPSYFPDQNYIKVGSYAPVMHYLKYQGELLVVKKDNRQEATIWHHSAEMSDTGAVFPLREGVSGVGAVAQDASGMLRDDPVFLSPEGVFAPVNTYTMAKLERGLQCRSTRINPRLRRARGLSGAVATVWQGYYILCVDGACYVADANQNRDRDGYEWYYWEGVPATCFATESDDLYFGTDDGRVCRFNDDLIGEDGGLLMSAYTDDGAPIRWEWRSKLDPLGYPSRYKSLKKAGNSVQLKAFTRSSCEVLLRTERDFGVHKADLTVDILDFNDIDFSRFTFSTLKNHTIPFKAKVKKFLYLQIILRGEAPNEGFGILTATLRYGLGGYAKKRRT